MDGKRLAKDTVSPAAGISPSKVKLRDGRDKSSVSRIKKLRQRISASFGRLLYVGASTEKEPRETNHALSKEDTIPEHDPEVDDITTNGHHSYHSDGSSPPVYYSLNGTPDHRPVPHRLLQCLGHSLDETFDPSLVFQPSVYRDCASQSSLGHPSQCNYSGSVAEDRNSAAIYASGHTSVKRHHSTGDMLIAANTNHTVAPVRTRPLRPKSEGSFCMDGMRGKRASSFGYNSPFGKVDAYEKQEQLGEGSYATVYKGLSLLTNKVVALKEIRLQAEEGTPFTAIREASLLKGLKHANIVILHDIIHTKDTLTFVFEFVHTDLGQYLEKHTGGLNPRNIKLFLFQLLRGLLFCHSRRILHRDLKPQNLLISEIGELKLADFGLARAKSVPSKTYSHEVVTLWYRPPDVLLGSTDYTTSLDMWGVGCIFAEMVSGTATFPGMKDAWDQLDRIWQVLGTATEETWEGVTSLPHYCLDKFGFYPPRRLSQSVPKLAHIPYAEQLAHNLLQLEPRKRILAQDALHHQYFSDLPAKIYDLPDVASIFNIPGVKLAPEMDELLRTHIRTNPHASKPHSRSTGQSSSYKGPSAV